MAHRASRVGYLMKHMIPRGGRDAPQLCPIAPMYLSYTGHLRKELLGPGKDSGGRKRTDGLSDAVIALGMADGRWVFFGSFAAGHPSGTPPTDPDHHSNPSTNLG